MTEHELINDCESPEEVADVAALIRDPGRHERERQARTLRVLAEVADIG